MFTAYEEQVKAGVADLFYRIWGIATQAATSRKVTSSAFEQSWYFLGKKRSFSSIF